MNLLDKLNSRIRSKVTPEVIARAERGNSGPDIHDQMWAFSHHAAAHAAKKIVGEPAEPVPSFGM